MADKNSNSNNNARNSKSSLQELRKLPVSVNVYDLLPESRLSSFMWFTGISICHSGVVIRDEEWAFGGHDIEGVSGVYVTAPRAVPDNATFRTTIPIGFTILNDGEIRRQLDRLRAEFTGPSYDLLNKNCNHFVQEACLALCGKTPPAWINRIAGFGAKLPVCVSEAWVNPPLAELDPDFEDSAHLLPPSEVAPMQGMRNHMEDNGSFSTAEHDAYGETNVDQLLTEASGGKRLPIGSR